ncbi:MAG: hypothetical protein R3C10_19835 [Pirellulales bacterium]|nr:hypothetical protein [Planctomycetales bacterium]
MTISTSPDFQTTTSQAPLVERRQGDSGSRFAGAERRQFASTHDELTPAGREFAEAVDHYKLQHRRRYITHDEMLEVLRTLGYHR